MSYTANLIKSPHEISFSGNAITFSFAISPYSSIEQSMDIRLNVRVLVEQVFGSNLFTEVKAQPYLPNGNGKIDIDISSILDPYLEYFTPRLTQLNPVQAINQRKRFRIDYLLQIDNLPVGTVQQSEIFNVCKGGMSYDSFHPSLLFTQHITDNQRPLFFPIQKEYTGTKEVRFMFWMYPFTDQAPLKVVYKVYYEDNSIGTKTIDRTITLSKWGIGCVAAGYEQCKLQLIAPTKTPVRYTVEIQRSASNEVVIAPITFWIDHRSFYNTSTLLYRNSLGGIDTIRMRGQIDVEQEYSRENAVQTVPPNTYNNLNLFGEAIAVQNEEIPSYKGDTGFLRREMIDRLRDLFLSLQVIEEKDGKLIPVVLKNGKTKFFANRDTLLSLQIEWQHAYTNEYFTPSGLITLPNACPAMEELKVIQRNRRTLQIMYSIPVPYDRVEFEINNGIDVARFITTGNSGSFITDFVNPSSGAPVNITVRGRVLCNEDVDPVDAGPWLARIIQVIANSLPVAVDDLFNIASGQTGPIQLVGSVLTNDYDPDGDALEVVSQSNQTTTQGGTFSIAANGIVTYSPPNINYVGTDSFTYQVREVGGTATSTATVRISVGGAAVGIFARLVLRNSNTSSSEFVTISYGEFWIEFFADTALTVPIDVTALNLTINYDEILFTQQYDGSNDTNVTAKTINPTGTRVRIFEGNFFEQYVDQFQPSPLTTTYSFVIKPGTGYIPV